MTKRNKAYRPRPVRTPPFMMRLLPELTNEDHDSLDIRVLTALDAVRRGDNNIEALDAVRSAMQIGFVLAAAFESKGDLQGVFLLGMAGMNGIFNAMRHRLETSQEDRDAMCQPAQAAIECLTEMERQCDRQTLVRAMRTAQDNAATLCAIARGACFLVTPGESGEGISNRRLTKKRGMVYINGLLRTGYLKVNKTMEGRLEWFDPINETTIPITKPHLILLAEPLKEKDLK